MNLLIILFSLIIVATLFKQTVLMFSFSLFNSRANNKNGLTGIMFLSTVFTLFCLMASVPSSCVSKCNDQLFSGNTFTSSAREIPQGIPQGIRGPLEYRSAYQPRVSYYSYLFLSYIYSFLLLFTDSLLILLLSVLPVSIHESLIDSQIWNIELEKDREKEKVGGRPAKLNEKKDNRGLEREIKNKEDFFVGRTT